MVGSSVELEFSSSTESAPFAVLNCSAMLCAAPSPVITQLSENGSVFPAALLNACVSMRSPAFAVEQAALSVSAADAATTPVLVPTLPLAWMLNFQPVGIVTVLHRLVLSMTT